MKFTTKQINNVLKMLQGVDMAFIDLFCGAGGATTGIKKAGSKVFLCINHDEMAIESHKANDDAIHLIEDIRKANVSEISRLCRIIRSRFPHIKIGLWFSAECTNFSKAKGGLPRNADSRSLADDVLNFYISEILFDVIYVENVVEFMAWGPLDRNGKPVSKREGSDFLRWIREMKECRNYKYEHRILNAADFGAYTSRVRYFGQFVLQELEIAWPEPTHSKKVNTGGLFEGQKKWKAVREVLDLETIGESIFTRKKPLSEKTLERIYAGLIKFIAGGKEAFISKYFSGNPNDKNISTDGPTGTITCVDHHALVQPAFISKYFSGKPEGKNIPVDGPSGTVTCFNNQALVQPQFLTLYYSDGGGQLGSINNPSATIPTKDRIALIGTHFISRDFGNGSQQSIDNPSGSLLAIPKSNLVTAKTFVFIPNYKGHYRSIDDPSATLLASRKHHYIINPAWFNTSGGSVEDPMPTLIARMDKVPHYLVCAERGEIYIEVFESDSPFTRKIKEFMAMYGIYDICMRMLTIPEMLRIQGFPEGYILKGTQTQQKKYIGNSVEVTIAAALIGACLDRNIPRNQLKKTA